MMEMKHVRSVATAGLLLLVVWLGWEVWRAMLERTTSLTEVSAKKRELATLRIELESVIAARASTAKPASELAAPAPNAKANVNSPAAPKPMDPRIANRAKEMSRRNTLNRYTAGFDRLRLEPDVLARAKEIILAREEVSANAPKQRLSMEDAVEEWNRLNEAMYGQLTALLGAEAVVELKSASRESSLDWTIGTDMWDGGAPLNPDQLRALARSEVQSGFRSDRWPLPERAENAVDPKSGLSRQDIAWLAATSAFLSPAQQAILQRSLIEEHQYNAAMRAFGEKQRELLRSP